MAQFEDFDNFTLDMLNSLANYINLYMCMYVSTIHGSKSFDHCDAWSRQPLVGLSLTQTKQEKGWVTFLDHRACRHSTVNNFDNNLISHGGFSSKKEEIKL